MLIMTGIFKNSNSNSLAVFVKPQLNVSYRSRVQTFI